MIVYLHGLNSSGSANKARWLREQLAPIAFHAPTYPAHLADESMRLLRAALTAWRHAAPGDDRLMLIGSSLGGFYAQALAAEFGARLVLINPSVNPHQTLHRILGSQVNEATGERYELTLAHVQAFVPYAIDRCRREVPTLLLLDEGDEVIDYRTARDFYHDCAITRVYADGSHRFDHLPESLENIRALYAAD